MKGWEEIIYNKEVKKAKIEGGLERDGVKNDINKFKNKKIKNKKIKK